MSWSTAGVQTGTDTDLSGMSAITGATSSVINGITVWTIPNQITISGTLTFDATVERFRGSSTTQSEQLRFTSGGTMNAYGGQATASFGNGARLDSHPLAFELGKTGTQCCSGGSVAVESGGRMNLYGVRIAVDSVMAWESGSGGIIRNSIFHTKTVPTTNTTRIRVSGAANWDIQGLDLYNMQFDWLTDEAFIASTGMRGLNAGLPIEHATGTDGATRAWREVRDPRGAADAFGNNWNGLKNVRLTLLEVGTGTMIVPDSCDGSSGGGHGALLFHEYTLSVVGPTAVSGKCFVRDTDNGNRKTITTPNTIEDTDQDQFLITAITASAGALTTILIGHWYRDNSVGDLAAPDGNEILDARGKNDVTEATSDDSIRDLFDVHFKGLDWSYGGAPDTQMNGLSVSSVFIGVLPDTGRDSDDAAAIAAYTSLSTHRKIHNAMKAWSILDANLELPSSTTFLISTSAASSDLGSYDIDLINGTDADPFDFSANKITAYIGTGFVGGLETTGDINIETSVVVDGSVFTGNVFLNWAADMSNVTVNGDLVIDAPAPGSGITQVGATEAVSTGEDDEITIAFPAGIADDDVAYIAVGHAQSEENEWNTPSGWVIPAGLTEVQTGGTPASTPGVTVFRRVLSGDSGSVTITNVGTNTSGIVAQMIVYRGVDTTTPEDAAPVTASGASGDPNPASITPVNNNSMILTFGFMDDGDQTTPTQPSGYTAILDTQTPDGAGTGED